MHRRTAIKALAAAAGAAAASACTTSGPAAAPAGPADTAASPADTAASPAETAASRPAAQPSETRRTAPTQTFALTREQLALARGGDRPLPTTIWRPRSTGRFPLILFSHGLSATPTAYAELLTTWAAAGFVIAAPAYPHTAGGVPDYNPVDVFNQPTDAGHVLTEVLGRLTDQIDPAQVAAAGHSAGGLTTLGMLAGRRDERLRAGVILSGRQIVVTPLAGTAIPLLFVHGERDRTIPYADGRAVYDAVTWPKAFLTFPGGGHVATGPELDVIAATALDFWRWILYGDTTAKGRLPADATRGGLATLDDDL